MIQTPRRLPTCRCTATPIRTSVSYCRVALAVNVTSSSCTIVPTPLWRRPCHTSAGALRLSVSNTDGQGMAPLPRCGCTQWCFRTQNETVVDYASVCVIFLCEACSTATSNTKDVNRALPGQRKGYGPSDPVPRLSVCLIAITYWSRHAVSVVPMY